MTKLNRDDVIILGKQGHKPKTIAAFFGVSQGRINQILREAGVPRQTIKPRVVALRRQGWTLQAIADRYGRTRARICQILKEAGEPTLPRDDMRNYGLTNRADCAIS